MSTSVEQINTPQESTLVNDPEDTETSTIEQEESMQTDATEQNTNEVDFIEESVAEVVVLSAPQTEDTIPLETNETPGMSNDSPEATAGPSNSRTSQTETATSSVATETAAPTNPLARPTRIIHFIGHQSYSGGVEINRRYVDLKYELIKKKVDFLRLKRERLMEEFDLRMKLLRTQLTFEEKKLLIFRKKYRRNRL